MHGVQKIIKLAGLYGVARKKNNQADWATRRCTAARKKIIKLAGLHGAARKKIHITVESLSSFL